MDGFIGIGRAEMRTGLEFGQGGQSGQVVLHAALAVEGQIAVMMAVIEARRRGLCLRAI